LCRTTRAPEWGHQHGISRLRSGFDIVPADKDIARNLSKAEGVTADGACTPAYVIGLVCSSWGHRIRRARGLEGQLQSVWAAYSLTTDRRISQEAADELQICRFRETQRVSWTEVVRSVSAALTTAPPQRFTVVSRPVAETSPRVPDPKRVGMHLSWPISTSSNRGRKRRFLAYSFPSRSPGPHLLAVLAGSDFVGDRSPPIPSPHGSGCPQLNRPAATGSAAKVSHLLSNQQRLRAHATAREDVRAGGARKVSLRTAVAADLCHQSHRRRRRLAQRWNYLAHR
jgi:hypothetical protein